MVTIQVLGAVLLVCFGLLLGCSWTIQAVQHKLPQQAEERRRLNEEWTAVRAILRQRSQCPRCASPHATPSVADLLLRVGERDPVAWDEILHRYSKFDEGRISAGGRTCR